MAIVTLRSKGQITIPVEIRKGLKIKKSDKVIIVIEGDKIIIKPLKGTIVDIGGSIKVPTKEKPADFAKIRREVQEKVAKKIAKGR